MKAPLSDEMLDILEQVEAKAYARGQLDALRVQPGGAS